MIRFILRFVPAALKPWLRRLRNRWRMYRFRRTAPPAATWDLICFPLIDWDFRWQRPQQLLSRFADAGHRVFLFKIGDALPPGGRPFTVALLRDNVWEITLALPAKLDVNAGALDPAIVAWFPEMLDALRRELNTVCAVSLVHIATWREVAVEARRRFGWKVVYDCMDDWSAFPGMAARLIDEERRLVAEADVVTVTSERLRAKWGGALIRNAADFDHFSAPSSDRPALPYGHPIVGYFGAIASWFDVGLVARAAAGRPHVSFVLVGGVFDVDVAPLRALPNVHLLGQQPYAEMPACLRDFDVCMIPFVADEVTAATDPVKFYEYLAQGKPVVSTPMPELDAFRDLFYAFDALDAALAENDPSRRARRIEAARANTWTHRAAAMTDAIRAAHPRVSVIVISYNNQELTRACIDSVLRASLHPNLEVIVVDNASADGSAEMLQRFGDPRVRVILNAENRGFAAANNQGLAAASGEFLVLLNNDTVVPRGWLPRMLRHLDDPEIGLVNAVTNFSGNESRIDVPYANVTQMDAFAQRYMREHEGERFDIRCAAMYCVGMRRDAYARIGPLDAAFGIGMFEDDDYSHRARLAGLRVVCAEDVFVHHYGQASFSKLDAATYEALWKRNQAHFEQKWGVPWQPHEMRKR